MVCCSPPLGNIRTECKSDLCYPIFQGCNNTTKGAPPLITSAALPHYLNLPSTWMINYHTTAMANKAFISSNKSNTIKLTGAVPDWTIFITHRLIDIP